MFTPVDRLANLLFAMLEAGAWVGGAEVVVGHEDVVPVFWSSQVSEWRKRW